MYVCMYDTVVLPCLKNSSMMCSLHVLLRDRHREGLLMSAAFIAICACEIGEEFVQGHINRGSVARHEIEAFQYPMAR